VKRSSGRRRLTPLVLVAVVLAAAPAARAADGLGSYVALGDSYTSAPLVPNQHGDPIDCGRSDHNYPSLVAEALKPTSFVDVSCGSAQTKDMTAPQTDLPLGGTNPPQFNALSPGVDLVTVGIGGNDAGLVGVATDCGELDATSPNGTPCKDKYTAGGRDQVAEKIEKARPKIAAVLQGIHARSPHARVAIVGYPHVTPPNGESCWPLVPLSPGDMHYVDELIIRINKMIEEEARANDAEFVDTYRDSGGHDVCKLPPERWFEGIVPTEPAYPMHPNGKGEASMARSALSVLQQPAPVPVITKLRVRRRVAAGRPARVRFVLNRVATVTLKLRRRVHGRRPGRVLATRTIDGKRGANRVKLRGRFLRRRPGTYRLSATPATHAATGAARSTRLRVRGHA
jgi:lysophospholipase L1-like esterase